MNKYYLGLQPSGSEAELLAKRDSLIFTLLEMLKSVEISTPLHQPVSTSTDSAGKKKYDIIYTSIECLS